MDLKEKIRSLPNSPGVYLMKGPKKEVLYVGKAINLKKRVSSYFRSYSRLSERIGLMVSQIKDISFIPTQNEAEALIYENSLIKQFSPKYNVALKDSKSYPLLKLTTNEKYPRLFMTRQKKSDGAAYYGPYTNAKLLRAAITMLKRIFPLRTCNKMPKNVCLNFHIKQCLGPCEGKVSEAGYKELVEELKLFLEGRKQELLQLVMEKMQKASKEADYEEAAMLRDRLEALSVVKTSRVFYSPMNDVNELRDILGLKGRLDSIEAFDVSNIMGAEAVGSMVYFYKGKPRKGEYRKFKIRSVAGIDDYGMIREIVNRRYRRILEEKGAMPDLILIDGGMGHLNAAIDELNKLGAPDVPVISIAKEFEHLYLKDKDEPLVLPKESKALHLIERIRDEAHRFAISYHKGLMSKRIEASELDDVKGIGRKRRMALINHFGSIDKIASASVDELVEVKGMNEKSARSIIEYFKR